jgi:hypothetical protein
MREMKVLSHEAESLRGEYLARIRQTKKRYYDGMLAILREIRGDRRGNGRALRLAAMTLFGSMNWIYTWYRPEVDGDAKRLTDFILGTFLRGFLSPHRVPSGCPLPTHPPSGERERGRVGPLHSAKRAGSVRGLPMRRSARKE